MRGEKKTKKAKKIQNGTEESVDKNQNENAGDRGNLISRPRKMRQR
jgi:hypothetical protein